jgi:integrase/recombinase XerD
VEEMTETATAKRSLASSHNKLIERFADDCELRGMSHSTIERYVSSIKGFGDYIKSRECNFVDAANRELLRDFLDYLRRNRNLSQKTIENSFTALSSFYEYLEYEGYTDKNPVGSVRKRYIRRYKDHEEGQMRKLISVEEMARLINSTLDIRDKAIITILAKTGIRRKELIALDIEDIDFVEQKLTLKPAAKRTNRTLFFDDETAVILRRWIRMREGRNTKRSHALFINSVGNRLQRHGVYEAVSNAAIRANLHDPASEKMEDHFSPHCCRHWFTTHLRRAGMSREFIQELRGDARREAIDIYDHIDKKELRESYLAHIPQLGI